jgi:hypothetical protein
LAWQEQEAGSASAASRPLYPQLLSLLLAYLCIKDLAALAPHDVEWVIFEEQGKVGAQVSPPLAQNARLLAAVFCGGGGRKGGLYDYNTHFHLYFFVVCAPGLPLVASCALIGAAWKKVGRRPGSLSGTLCEVNVRRCECVCECGGLSFFIRTS